MRVLVFPSTLVGYARVGLLLFAVEEALSIEPDPLSVIGCLLASRLLDLLDGALARRLAQTTLFGSVFDLLTDLATHSVVWWLSGLPIAGFLVSLEWAAGIGVVVTMVKGDTVWKPALLDNAPGWIRSYFEQNQRNILCAYACIGHFLVPTAAFLGVASLSIQATFLPGLILYEAVTVYLFYATIRHRLEP